MLNKPEPSGGGGGSESGPKHQSSFVVPQGGAGAASGQINSAQFGGVSGISGLNGQGVLHLPSQVEPYRHAIVNASNPMGIPSNVTAAQIWAESKGNLNPSSTNVNGKIGAGLIWQY